MDPKMVRMAREIPERLKEIMNSMFEASEPALRSGVSSLRESLNKLDGYLKSVEQEHLGTSTTRTGRRMGRPAGSKNKVKVAGAEPVVRRRRKRGRFGISEFIVAELSKSSKGMRPVEIAVKVSEETGRSRQNSTSNVNTTLARLKAMGQVKNNDGIWSATGSSGKTATKKATKTPRRRGPGKKKSLKQQIEESRASSAEE